MNIAERIKMRADEIVKDMQGDIDAVARYAARLSLIYEIDETVRIMSFDQAIEEMGKLKRDKKEVFDCDMCGAVPCGMGCHEEEYASTD